jgi:KDO2-lipid IV(A) lauroyltransferase
LTHAAREEPAVLTRAAIALAWLLHLLPFHLLAKVGESLGSLLYVIGRERRYVCLTNLERCFPDMPESERVALAKAHFRAFGRSVLERSILWWAPRERVIDLVRVVGLERIKALRGQPLILLAPHFVGLDAGCTRLTCEIDMAGIYAKQKDPVFNALLLSGRTRFGRQRAISRQEGVRPALAAVKEGIPFYYLPDLDYGARDAIFVPFFAASAATITGLSRMTRLTGARVLPCVTRMLPGGAGYELRCYPAWEGFPGGDDAADARRMNAFIEERVREMPEQYFWTHKRFKTRPAGEAKWY